MLFRSMPSKKELCRNWKLYVITCPSPSGGRSQAERVREAVLGGAEAVQLRDKNASGEALLHQARELLAVTRPMGMPLIINDRVAVAKACDADGVHLGQDDGSLADAMNILGPDKIYGRSTHTPEQRDAAEEEGFDYIGVGPVFATPTKPGRRAVGLDYVRYAASHPELPFVAIGGIDETNIREVLRAGATQVAVVRAVLAQADPKRAAENLKKYMKGSEQ